MPEPALAEQPHPARLPYEPPGLEPLTFTPMSKHLAAGIAPAPAPDHEMDAAALVERFGSPLFVVSEGRLRELYRAFAGAFSAPGVETRVAYSYKTNYLPAVCAALHDEGAWAEVVSGMEYRLARALGVPAARIVFNGPGKSAGELALALGEGALVNVDGFDELARVEHIAGTLGRPVRIGLRVSFRHGPGAWTKFGFSHDNGDVARALERIAAHRHLALELLHNHGGTFVLTPELYARATEVLIDVARRARRLGLAPTTLDLGGGYPSTNRLKPAFDFPAGSRRRHALFPYAEAILSRLQRAGDAFGGCPALVLEPGRAVVDDAVQLLCRVVATKDVPGQAKAVVVDAGVNLVPTAYWYDHPVRAGGGPDERRLERVDVYGPLCMQIDLLREGALLPPLAAGDVLVLSNVGAYCHTQSMQFIQPRPATVLLGPGGPELIRRREDWRDVFALDRVPARLQSEDHAL